MKKNWLLLGALMATVYTGAWADDFEDDIYFDPSIKTSKIAGKKSLKANYISNFNEMDVDEYNRRGQYYTSPVDTIGTYVEAGEDFVYTQKIQKFYNPTIVVDNAEMLKSVLNNSYGNVEVVYNIDGPVFSSIYSPWNALPLSWYAPYYATNWGWATWNSPYWGPAWTWSWGSPYWGASISWNWGPTWTYGPGWGFGGNWGWGGYRPPRPPHHHDFYGPGYAQWTPGRNLPNRPGWKDPYYGGNYAGNHTRPGTSVARPGTSRPGGSAVRPGSAGIGTRPTGTSIGGNRGMTSRPGTSTARPSGSSSRPNGMNTRPNSLSGNRGTATTTTGLGSSSSKSTSGSSSSSGSYNRGTFNNNSSSSSSYNRGSSSGSYNRGSSSSGSYNRGSSSGRSSGGSRGSSGGGRGGRR